MEFIDTEVEVTDTALSNSIRIAAGIARMTSDGMTTRNAIRQTAIALGISESSVCHALTVAEDFTADLRELQVA
jgi:hypothetical protein